MHLNTSYVEVKQDWVAPTISTNFNLNTSYVEVKRSAKGVKTYCS